MLERITPNNITNLQQDEIFVFGSNEAGLHLGGAARTALSFGAIMGKGVGLQGRTYAIPTLTVDFERVSLIFLKREILNFINFTKEATNLIFFVTAIGTGIAGFSLNQIAPLFKEAKDLENVYLPKEFLDYLN